MPFYTHVTLNHDGAVAACMLLMSRSAEFLVTPLSCGRYDIQYKAGEGHEKAISSMTRETVDPCPLWTVVWSDTGLAVPPLDSNPGNDDDGMLVYRSFDSAKSAAEHQSEMYKGTAIAVPLSSLAGNHETVGGNCGNT